METRNALCAVFEINHQQLLTNNDVSGRISPRKLMVIALSSILVGFLCGVLLMFLIQ